MKTFAQRLAKILGAGESRTVLRAANSLAYSTLDDNEASLHLRERIRGHDRGIRTTMTILGRRRNEFAHDRAYRLLAAATTGTPVQPIAAEWIDHFGREEELGRLPLGDAFTRLKELEPMLVDPHLEHLPVSHNETLVGPMAQHPDPLVRSRLALCIILQYQAIAEGDVGYGDVHTSYFSAPRKLVALVSDVRRAGVPEPPTFLS